MNLQELIRLTRRNVNDPDGNIYKSEDVTYYVNEGIDRFKTNIYFVNELPLVQPTDVPTLIPNQYHHLLGVYASARCFSMDERHYQASTMMNEFEIKLEEMLTKIESGEVIITDEFGNEVDADYEEDYVVDIYFNRNTITDLETAPD